MPLRFERPAAALSLGAIVPGARIWQVYGIWPIQTVHAYEVASAPIRFADHAEYEEILNKHADHLVFDVKDIKNGHVSREYAVSWNLVPNDHNDNYVFGSAYDAAAAVEWIKKQYMENPEILAEELERHAIFDMFDDIMEDRYDDHPEEDAWDDDRYIQEDDFPEYDD